MRVVKLAGVLSAVLVGAVVLSVLAGSLYLTLTPATCRDVLELREMQQCAAPSAPWWLLLAAGLVGGGLAGALTYRLLDRRPAG